MPAKGIDVQVRDSTTPIKFTSAEPNLAAELDTTNGILRISKSGVVCGEFTQATLVGWWYE